MMSPEKIKIVFLTGTRADYGKLKSLIKITSKSELFEVHIFATGMHLNSKYGRTIDEITKSGFTNVFPYINHGEVNNMDRTLARTVEGLASFVEEIQPDILVIHGDRIEALAGATVGSLNNLLVIHIEGGELSGTVDDSIRHAVTKLSHVHMVANEAAKKRILQLGEKEAQIHIIGSPDLDLMRPQRLPAFDKVKSRYEVPFDDYALCMFHPVTTEIKDFPQYTRWFFKALKRSSQNYIVVYPNNDLGCDYIIREICRLQGQPRFRVYKSLRFEYFLRLLQRSQFIIGNSSAGIREAPYYRVPTINVGTRQNNRSDAGSIVNTDYSVSGILAGIDRIMHETVRFDEDERRCFGRGDSDRQFLDIISNPDFLKTSRQKYFQELDM